MSEDLADSLRSRSHRQWRRLVAGTLMLVLMCCLVLASWAFGHSAGEREAEAERLRAQQAELDWHDAHPDPTEPILPDHSSYLGQLSQEVAQP
jgi:hypothetical protein